MLYQYFKRIYCAGKAVQRTPEKKAYTFGSVIFDKFIEVSHTDTLINAKEVPGLLKKKGRHLV